MSAKSHHELTQHAASEQKCQRAQHQRVAAGNRSGGWDHAFSLSGSGLLPPVDGVVQLLGLGEHSRLPIGRANQISGADFFAAGLIPIVQALQSSGATTLEAITRGLNERGVRTARGARWHVSSVANLLSRTKSLAEAR